MYCYRKVTDDLYWIGANDRRLRLFEGVYEVPQGVSYNSYLLLDEKTVLFDTVDKAVGEVFFENLEHLLEGRHLDIVIVHHMEPDHSATLGELLLRYPDVKVVCSAKTAAMMQQFFTFRSELDVRAVKEGENLETGKHTFSFVMAPMVHWPEVMLTYDQSAGILFSADAFGTFGALDGALFADEVDFERDYLDEARRYYANIVGKYGTQVQNVLKKAAALDLKLICPLHGFIWRENLPFYLEKYQRWSSYQPEEAGVVIAYASIYGHTANAAEILACALRERGVKVKMFDVSVSPAADVVAAIFRYSHVVFAAPTYNAGIFVRMEDLLHDLKAHAFQNRTAALIEGGSWAISSGRQMRELLEGCKNITVLENVVTVKSALKEEQLESLQVLADSLAADIA